MGWQDAPLEGSAKWQSAPKLSEDAPSQFKQFSESLETAREVPKALIRNMAAPLVKGALEALGPSKLTRDVLGLPENKIPAQIWEAISYQPKSPAVQAGMDVLAWPGRKYGELAHSAGQKAESASGSPMLGEMVEKSIKIAPYGIGRTPAGPEMSAVEAARSAGFKLTPTERGAGGPISRSLTGLSNEARLQRLIGQKNAEVVNQKIAQDFGFPPGMEVTKEALETVRKTAGDAYKAVANTGKVVSDKAYLKDLEAIRDRFAPAARDFPGAANKSVFKELKGIANDTFGADAGVQMVNQLRDKASTAYRAGSATEGAAYKAMAKAIEDQLERHLVAVGQPAEFVESMKAARTTIAKTYMAEEALNAVTGQIKPGVYGKAAAAGKPLTGGAKEVGEAAAAFPRSLQSPATYLGTGPAYGDVLLGVANRALNPAGGLGGDLLSVGIRPMIRSGLASDWGQSLVGRPFAAEALGYGVAPGLLLPKEER